MAESITITTPGISTMHFPAGIEADRLSSGETVEPGILASGATQGIRMIPGNIAPGTTGIRGAIAGEPVGIIRAPDFTGIAGDPIQVPRKETETTAGKPAGMTRERRTGTIAGKPTTATGEPETYTIPCIPGQIPCVPGTGTMRAPLLKHSDGNELVYEAMQVLTDHDYRAGRILGESVLPISIVALKNTEILFVLVIRSRNPVPSAKSLFDQYRARVDVLRALAVSPHDKIMIWVYSLQCGWRYYWVNPHAIGYDWDFAKLIGKPSPEFSFFQFGF